MAVGIVKEVLDEIITCAAGSPDAEVCGLLLGAPDRIDGVMHGCNVSHEPQRSFEIDPAQIISALRAERAGGARVIGCYHSHPTGASTPSERDAASAQPNGWLWLIAAGRDIGAYRAVPNGQYHGRFQPIRLEVIG